MNIGAVQINHFGGSNNMWDMLRESGPRKTGSTSESPSDGSQPDSFSSTSSQSKMSGLFAETPREESRYLSATLQSFSIANQINSDMASQMFSLLDHFGGINPSGTFFPKPVSRVEVEEVVGQKADKEVLEATEDLLDEMTDELDQKAEEALAPEERADTEATAGKEPISDVSEPSETEDFSATDASNEAGLSKDVLHSENPLDTAAEQSIADEGQSLTEVIAAEVEAVAERQMEQSRETEQGAQVAAASTLTHSVVPSYTLSSRP